MPRDGLEAAQQRLSTLAGMGRRQLTGGEGAVVSAHPRWWYVPAWVPSARSGPAGHSLTSLPLLPQHQGEIVSSRKTAQLTPHPPVHGAYGPFTSLSSSFIKVFFSYEDSPSAMPLLE